MVLSQLKIAIILVNSFELEDWINGQNKTGSPTRTLLVPESQRDWKEMLSSPKLQRHEIKYTRDLQNLDKNESKEVSD